MYTELIVNYAKEAYLLGLFKNFCLDSSDYKRKNSLRNILSASYDKNRTIKNIFYREYKIDLSTEETNRMVDLVLAFLKKSEFRKEYDDYTKNKILSIQNHKCALCGKDLTNCYHLDHIVPFKYVGDELENNLQMLCSSCNHKKNASIDYQIRHLLKIV